MHFRPPTPGVLLDNKYRLADRIGGGGMGDVYRGENVLAGRSVAIKFLHPELAQNTELAHRFFQEAQAVNKIRHPNIVDVLDAGQGEMGPYIVMEFLEGESVGSALARLGRFDAEGAIATAIPVLEALDAAHRAGIVHRDLKPENVFIALDAAKTAPVVRLLDFGIAKVLDSTGQRPRTRTGVVFGTPDYLSPEQATGDAPLDGRSDLFAVGVLLYELLTGTRPFRAPTAVATAFRVVHAEAPTVAAAGIHVDPRLETIVDRLLQKDPAKRYATAGDVSRELERISPDAGKRRDALAKIINLGKRAAADPRRRPVFDSSVASAIGSRITRERPSRPGSTPDDFSRRSSRQPSSSDSEPLPRDSAPSSPARAARPTTPIRPFPERFAGRFQVRGPVLRSIDRAVVELFDKAVRDEIVAQMPERYAADFRNDSINALVAYDLEALDAYMELATQLAVRDTARWRELGRHAVDGELFNVVRTLLRPAADLSSVIRRGVTIWARLFSFGAWRVSSGPESRPGRFGVVSTPDARPRGPEAQFGRVGLHIAELDAVSVQLRLWIVGVVEQTARRAIGEEVKVSIVSGELSFTPELACEIC